MTTKAAQPSAGAIRAATDFVYKIHAWAGRSPEFMQTQKHRLAEVISRETHDTELLEALKGLTTLLCNMRDVYGSKHSEWMINGGVYQAAQQAIRKAEEGS